jgi:uncharacterized membrane protein YeaQ/YmgE (transglycosylase-associated protein family)
MHWLWVILIGLVIGAVAKLLMPPNVALAATYPDFE